MISEVQIHTIARQMFEKHGPEAIPQAAQKALASERKGDSQGMASYRAGDEDDAGTASRLAVRFEIYSADACRFLLHGC